jgi:hypothetical protein
MVIGRGASRLGKIGRILGGLIAACACVVAAHAADDFKLLSGTESPGHRYALAYGVSDLKSKTLDQLRLAGADDAAFDRDFLQKLREVEAPVPHNMRNYLVNLRSGRAVAVVPGFHYFPGQNHFDLEVAWSRDSKEGLAIYDFRYGNNGVVWMEPQRRQVTDATAALEDAFRHVLAQREGKAYTRRATEYSFTLLDPIILRRDEFVLGVAHA